MAGGNLNSWRLKLSGSGMGLAGAADRSSLPTVTPCGIDFRTIRSQVSQTSHVQTQGSKSKGPGDELLAAWTLVTYTQTQRHFRHILFLEAVSSPLRCEQQ